VLSIVGKLTRNLVEACYREDIELKIQQLFILTHNPYFFLAVSKDYLGTDNNHFCKISFFEVKKSEDNISTVKVCEMRKDNDRDEDYKNYSPVQNYYTTLWNEYKDVRLTPTLVSVMRRIIEFHLIETCTYTKNSLYNIVMNSVADNDPKKKLFENILKDISDEITGLPEFHDVSGGIYYTETDDHNDEYREAFKAVFEALGMASHYDKMSGETETDL
jgi:wobble nucleotide-excising tRNase